MTTPGHPSPSHCQIIPPFLLERLGAGRGDQAPVVDIGATLDIDASIRSRRASAPQAPAAADSPFAVYDAESGSDLPGQLVRKKGDPESKDVAVNEAYAGVEATLALYQEVYDRSSFDDHGAEVRASVHFEKDYDNAFWNGDQLVFGDGDGTVFERFTIAVDVLGHELTHAVTQYAANLTYQDQSGALNESVSDVFGSCVKQRLAGESAADADWLIGEGLFKPEIHGVALRSMQAPGTAYDDPAIGKDPQVATMDDYVDTADDNGGVHTNSGIPNKAFYLAATAIGGSSWDGAGKVWYAALTSGLAADTDFATFAAATVVAATAVSSEAERAVTDAWAGVGVTPAASSGSTGEQPSVPAQRGSVSVTRSGGFAGISKTGAVALGDDPRTPEVESLLDRIDFATVAPAAPQPDRFVYTFDVHGERTVVGEPDLTPELHRLAGIVLPD